MTSPRTYRAGVTDARDVMHVTTRSHYATGRDPAAARHVAHALNVFERNHAFQVRLARIGAAHRAHAPVLDAVCLECGHRWPCSTYAWASGSRKDLTGVWNTPDDTSAAPTT